MYAFGFCGSMPINSLTRAIASTNFRSCTHSPARLSSISTLSSFGTASSSEGKLPQLNDSAETLRGIPKVRASDSIKTDLSILCPSRLFGEILAALWQIAFFYTAQSQRFKAQQKLGGSPQVLPPLTPPNPLGVA